MRPYHVATPAAPADMDYPGSVLLISCYELGQQPLGLVTPLAHLESAGFEPRAVDLSVERLSEDAVRRARLVAISVPMHTAMRMGIRVAQRVRKINPACHLAFYGLYAALNADYLLTISDSCFGGEFEAPLCDLARRMRDGSPPASPSRRPNLSQELEQARETRLTRPRPSRHVVPSLGRYAKLVIDGSTMNVGYVAATRGCKHLCRHCPIPPIYNGRFYAMPTREIIADIAALVQSGAEHISFGDPDFLNGPRHARRVVQTLHRRFPDLTFDYTAKIEHLRMHPDLVTELRDKGCVFVVSAVESLNNETLRILAKRHTRADVLHVFQQFRRIGHALRPTFVPFNPWDSIEDYVLLLDTIEKHQLIDAVDPVQLSIRLLVPPGSHLLEHASMQPHIGALDHPRFSYTWTHPDPRMDELNTAVHRRIEEDAADGIDPALTFFRIKRIAFDAIGQRDGCNRSETTIAREYPATRRKPPRLTENWFC